MSTDRTESKAASALRFAERFELHDELGRGGMAVVHRATDLGRDKTVALKQLTRSSASDAHRAQVEALFEREFHTLLQLKHPCVVEVYDYGLTPEGVAFYTMELLDSATLRDLAPVPWRRACRLIFDVCSALALLHSRRLLHRDVSPRNVHCAPDGHAKLIDFGAVGPMVADGPIVGTPAFTAPEIAQRSAVDARSDLYAVGATLYYALTGALPYPVRTFADLLTLRNQRPAAPSTRAQEIPKALDELVMSLLSFEPGLRPMSAFAVMQRLAAIAGLELREDEGVSRAYLVTPSLVGRDGLLATLRERLQRSIWTGDRALMLLGPSGIGRSRLLDACVLEAKTLGARVLRATVRGTPQDLETAYALTQHLFETYPSEQLAQEFQQLFEPMKPGVRPQLRPLSQLVAAEGLEQAFVPLMRAASKSQPLVFAVDDVHRIDERSAAQIAALLERFRLGRAAVVLTAEQNGQPYSQALSALLNRSDAFVLAPLNEQDTTNLLASVFGEVPNLARVAEQIYRIARGNPATSMSLAQHLVDRGTISYHAGVWTLPAALSVSDLPQSTEAAVQAQVAQLSPLARFLAQAHALSYLDQLALDAYRQLEPSAEPGAVDAALTELMSQQALISDGERYLLTNRLWVDALERSLDEPTRSRAHRALAALFKSKVQYAWIYHALAAKSGDEDESAALDALLAKYEQSGNEDVHHIADGNYHKIASIYPEAFRVAERLGRPARQQHDLRRGLLGTSIAAGEPAYYRMVAAEILDQLVHDTGLDLYRKDSASQEPGERLTRALTEAFGRYQALPEGARGYRPDEAIPFLSEYVAISIAVGVRTMDYPLLRSLPELLEPFAPLSPLIAALWQNAIGCCEAHVHCRYEAARARWMNVIDTLRDVSGAEMRHVTAIRNAIQYALGSVEAVLGLADATRWVDGLDDDPYQSVSALYVRKIVRLEHGDWPGATHLQRRAEVLALRNRVPQMFAATLPIELMAYVLARDVAGVKDILERERVEAARYPGWIPYLCAAEAYFELVRGDLQRAEAAFERAIELTALDEDLASPCMPMWMHAHAGLFETLLALERYAEVQTRASAALAICEKLQIVIFTGDLVRLLAMAEAGLGDFVTANQRLDKLIEMQTTFGVTGMRLGISYEARASIALASGDVEAFDKFARLTAREYRHGAGCPLGARYERLMSDARSRGVQLTVALTDFELTTTAESRFASLEELRAAVREALSNAKGRDELYRDALRLLCSARAAKGGHLFLPASQALQLVASCDLPAPNAQLIEHVSELLKAEQDRFETQTIALEELHDPQTSTIVHADGLDYELLMLASFTAEETSLVGVAALALGEQPKTHPLQAQLLATIAEQLSAAAE